MALIGRCPRQFICDFIQLYKSFPCLWHSKTRDYVDQTKREKALIVLLRKCKELHDAANTETVLCYINSLRATYEQEMQKINESLLSNTSIADIYKPTVWYFHKLDFLSQCKRVEEYTENDGTDGATEKLDQYEELSNQEEEWKISDETDEQFVPESFSSTGQPRVKLSSRLKRSPKTDQRTGPAEGKRDPPVPKDSVDTFGSYVTAKLRTFSRIQCAISQKLIMDVIFAAEMKRLTTECRIEVGNSIDKLSWVPEQLSEDICIEESVFDEFSETTFPTEAGLM
uniref:MADF domain-containing protein n=1 Tax=Anopheles atroparvus TaxID=41427 RepID=A0AAG5CPW4_ANOAO